MNAGIISEYFRRDYVKAVRVRSQVANRFLYCSCAHTADKTGYIAFSIAKAIVCYDPNDQKNSPRYILRSISRHGQLCVCQLRVA